jgi:protein TonB
MLAYAANAPRTAERRSSPNALLAIIAGHVALVALVMSAKMDLPVRILDGPITLIPIRPIDPPPPPDRPQPASHSHLSTVTQPQPNVPLPPIDTVPVDPNPPTPIVDSWPGQSVDPPPVPHPVPATVSVAARLLTSGEALKPPYPQAKLLAEQEATLKLRLTIDDHGRVVAVDPVGHADPAFLDAARRHLLAHWRYQPASEGGRTVVSTTVITLRFQLNG